MPRSKGETGSVVRQREALENVLASLVRIEYLHPITILRVRQARDRGGLGNLLGPALEEMDEMGVTVSAAKAQLMRAMTYLKGC